MCALSASESAEESHQGCARLRYSRAKHHRHHGASCDAIACGSDTEDCASDSLYNLISQRICISWPNAICICWEAHNCVLGINWNEQPMWLTCVRAQPKDKNHLWTDRGAHMSQFCVNSCGLSHTSRFAAGCKKWLTDFLWKNLFLPPFMGWGKSSGKSDSHSLPATELFH